MSRKATAAFALAIAILLWSTVKADFWWAFKNGATMRVELDCKQMSDQIAQANRLDLFVKAMQPECIKTNPIDTPECLANIATLIRIFDLKRALESDLKEKCAEAQAPKFLRAHSF